MDRFMWLAYFKLSVQIHKQVRYACNTQQAYN